MLSLALSLATRGQGKSREMLVEEQMETAGGEDVTVAEHGIPGLVIHPDDSVTRSPMVPDVPAKSQAEQGEIASRDVIIDSSASSCIWARLFVPNNVSTPLSSATPERLPVVVFFHGGAFVVLSAATGLYHQFCEKLAKEANVIVLSVNYGLAPEHRLPAAYDDAFSAIKWLQSQGVALYHGGDPDPWLALHADFSSIFVMGDSAGGNIAYHLSLRLAHEDIKPLRVKGLVLIQPSFGGTLKGAEGSTCIGNRRLWRLALPPGAEMDHFFCNPTSQPPSTVQNLVLPRTAVLLGGLDRMHDKQHEFVTWLMSAKQDVELTEFKNATHGFYLFPRDDTPAFFEKVIAYIYSKF
ncbi:hypothetical protein O6H91_02G117800 [Diphasiastrum complanatum]|uniref:Uncharacterized protein n=1 Tax=Diphasiastrum complanatum TaxID=34168 RepID=A0ACC2EK80_DIPCM|nr:hypothetical protein O6H91_02G117800 [Diphasiastrum complanatum]